MHVVNKVIVQFFKWQHSQIQQWVQNPLLAQQTLLQWLVQQAKHTRFGKKYHFNNIHNFESFSEHIPLQNYESLKGSIVQMMAGGQNILWPGKVCWYAKSSGTTSDKSKFIPVTAQALSQCHYKGGRHLMGLYCKHNPNTKLYAGKGLVIGGSHKMHQFNQQTQYGDLSAVLLQNIPRLGQFLRTPKCAIANIANWEEKIERIAQTSIHQNITHLVGVPTWNLVLIKRVLALTKKQHLLEVWPNLRLYIHGGVSFTPYRQQFEQYIPSKKMQYWQTYNASEGFFAIQESPERNDMLLMLNHGVLYEFIPLQQLQKTAPNSLWLHQVEVGVDYAMVISTNAGLWRYQIGDTVRFTSIKPYRIQVTGRTKAYINAFGEELMIDNANMALAEACRKTGASLSDYTAAPIYFSEQNNGTHEWLVEFTQMPSDITQFTQCLDQTLQQLNSDYEAKRFNNMGMRFPIVTPVPTGTFHKWLQQRGKLGGQHKIPRLSNSRQYIQAIKQLL